MNSVQYNGNWRQYNVTPLINIDALYTCYFLNHSAGYSFAGETHDFWEALYVVSGKVRVTADERVFTLSSGEIVFHKPLELHKLSVESKEGVKLLVFTFDASGTLANAMENKVLLLNTFCRGIIENMHRHMLNVCRNTIAENSETGSIAAHLLFPEKPEFVQMTATYISQLIIALAGEESRYTAENSEGAALFSKAVDYMNENIDKSINLSDIASHINVSESSVKRIFSKYATIGVHRYFLLLKINEATRLLKSGESVGSVAESLGFSSQGYFSACYKRETGKNPTDVKV